MNAFLETYAISPEEEMGAYEALWLYEKASFKTIADLFKNNPNKTPSQLVQQYEIDEALSELNKLIFNSNIKRYGVRINGTIDYPVHLRDAEHPLEFCYYRGNWDLVYSPKRIAIVGTRNPSPEGIKRAKKLTKLLVQDGYVIVSGLAKGIDYTAHTSAIEANGETIAVIGTPITEYYPKEHKELQELIAQKYLLISQVPIVRYSRQSYRGNRFFFPERNITMSALTQATVIIEASNTSGTLIQAKAALKQGRKLFILDSCFQNPEIDWPAKFEKQGAIRVREYEDIRSALGQ